MKGVFNMIKWIVSDMDGTLLNAQGTISPGNQAALQRAIAKGAKLVVATGRELSSVREILNQCQLSALAILGNGAQFVDENDRLLKTAYLDPSLFKPVTRIFDDLGIHYMIFAADGFYATHDPADVCEAFIQRCMHRFGRSREQTLSRGPMPCMQLIKIHDVDAFLQEAHDIIKVEAFSINEELIVKAKKQLSQLTGIAYLSSYSDNVEVTDAHAQKGLILEEAIQLLGLVKEEVMVLGDAFNDVTMFERFPYSFAMGNAEKAIKEMAYRVVANCEEDGVAEAIDWMFKEDH